MKILKTHLSRRPSPSALWAAAWSMAALMLFHLLYHRDIAGVAHLLTATREQVFTRHEYWRAFTTLGVHADLEHFLSNFGFFCGLAFLLQGYFGPWAFPVLSLAGGALANFLALGTYDANDTLVGASGVVYFMAAFWLSQYAGIERRLSVARRLVNCAAFTLVLLMPETFEPRVSYRTHAFGYALGWLLGGLYFLARRKSYRAGELTEVIPVETDADWPEWANPPAPPSIAAHGP